MKRWIAAATFMVIALAAYSIDLKTMYQDASPKFIIKNGTASGLCVDIMEGIQKTDPSIRFVADSKAFTPFARIETSLDTGDIDVFLGMIGNPERAAKFKLAYSIFKTSNVMVAQANETANFKTLEEFKPIAKDSPILVARGTAQVQDLLKMGLKVDECDSSGNALAKLLVGRQRFAFMADIIANRLIKDQGAEAKVRIYPSFTGRDDQYIAFSKKTPQATVDKVVAALSKMKSSGELDRITAPYFSAK
jgi:ABC-type amino acid transport substrate-binding protein